jgi:TPR repeat protein
MTITELLKRLKAKAQEEGYCEEFPPLSPDVVARCEEEMGVELPDIVRLVYTQVANGGIGPDDALIGLKGGFVEDDDEDVITLYKAWMNRSNDVWEDFDDEANDFKMEWISGLLPVCYHGCTMWTLLDCNVPGGRLIYADLAGPTNYKKEWDTDSGLFQKPGLPFDEWIATWLDEPGGKDQRQEDDRLDGESSDDYRIRKLAETGDMDASYEHARRMRDRGLRTKAEEEQLRKAELGDEYAKVILAKHYRDGLFGVDWDKAYYYAQQVEAPISFYVDGPKDSIYGLHSIDYSAQEAIAWWTKRAQEGDGRAAFSLGMIQEQDDEKRRWYELAANLGYVMALRMIGMEYWRGIDGRQHDMHKAIEWLTRAAQAGELRSQADLALHYAETEGDWQKAIYYWKKVIEHPPDPNHCVEASLLQLGRAYAMGQHVAQDIPRAIEYYERASKMGNSDADYVLACYILKGLHPRADVAEALVMLRRAADEEHGAIPEAQCKLAECYERGVGCEVDARQACFWTQQAALQGYSRAQCQLARYYEEGFGFKQDVKMALVWYSKAAAAGDETAYMKVRDLEGH